MEELKITKEKVLEAASKCPQAKETLKTIFPEAFKNKNIEIRSRRVYMDDYCIAVIDEDRIFLNNSNFKWEIKNAINNGSDDAELIPTRK